MGAPLPDGGYTRLIDGYNAAMVAAGVTNVKRAAMWAAQLGHESVGLRYMEELADGSAYNGRGDLGNTQPGDGPRFKGRGPIQLTGRNNYRAFTRWAQAQGHSTIDFESEPHRLSEPRWGFLAAAYYWTVARPQINSLADAGDLEGVTRAINGGLNGLADRRARYQRALQFGARLLPTPPHVTVKHPMGEPGAWTVSSGYGPRWGTQHLGLDFAAPLGTPIYAVADALVIQGAERAPGTVDGFGNWVWLDAQDSLGRDFIYGHMRHHEIYVRAGDRVKAGQLIARVGNEGGSTGPHLHFEVWGPPGRTSGRSEDPAVWLEKHLTNNQPQQEEGPFMALNDAEQRELLSKVRAIHHELTHRFDSRYDLDSLERGEITAKDVYKDTSIGYALNIDRKVEDIHRNMLPEIFRLLTNLTKGKL